MKTINIKSMKHAERRGSSIQKMLDQKIGPILLLLLAGLLRIKQFVCDRQKNSPDRVVVICIGAIGDLILLTEAVQRQWPKQTVFIVCSQSNYSCARAYQDVYAGIGVVNLRNPLSLHAICRKFSITRIYDSTQWANIGPLQVGFARLLGNGLSAIGFKTTSCIRGQIYNTAVLHNNSIHEVANFMNLLAEVDSIVDNHELPNLLPRLYRVQARNATRKVLFHMWPSGTRAYLKEWPETSWLELANEFDRRGYIIYLSGAPADKGRNEALMAKANLADIVNIAGLYDLSEFSAFIDAEIECSVSVNTGILHLVASLGVPLIGLHGPTNPDRWGPLGKNSVSLLPESGNFAYLNYGFEYPKEDAVAYALDKLTVQQVIAAFEQQQASNSEMN